jgi:hypothetical protein
MKRVTLLAGAAALVIGIAPSETLAQQPPQGPRPFFVGNPLGLPVESPTDGTFAGISSNVKVYGACPRSLKSFFSTTSSHLIETIRPGWSSHFVRPTWWMSPGDFFGLAWREASWVSYSGSGRARGFIRGWCGSS